MRSLAPIKWTLPLGWAAVVLAACEAAEAPTQGASVGDALASSEAAATESAPFAIPAPVGIHEAEEGAEADAADEEAAELGSCPRPYRCVPGALGEKPVDKLLIHKSRHELHVVRGDTIIKTFTVALGSGGLGQKLFEGDRRTPEGRYVVTGRYPSKWHTYLALDYPGPEDRARYEAAVKRGEAPAKVGAGSAIAIHGHRADQPSRRHKLFDWTLGCIALDNDEIDEIARVAPKGTVVEIVP